MLHVRWVLKSFTATVHGSVMDYRVASNERVWNRALITFYSKRTSLNGRTFTFVPNEREKERTNARTHGMTEAMERKELWMGAIQTFPRTADRH